MVLCCPSATLGGLVWWNILEQDQYFVVQQHKIGPPIWNPPFRILLKCNNHIVAEAKSKEELDKDLKLCQLKIQEALKERNNQPLASLTNELSTFFQNLWKEQQEIVILSSAMGNQPSSPGHPHGANSTKPTTPRKVSVTDQSKTETHKTDSKTTKAEEPKKHEPDTKKEDPKKEEKPKTPPSQKAEEKLDAAATAKLDHTPEDTSHMQKVPSNPDMLQWAKQQFDQLGEKGEETQKSVQSAELGTDSIPLELDPEDIKLGEFLGEGVYSEVYKGYCYGTQVAVKKFKNQGFDPEILKEVRKEVRIMKSLHHPNLLLFLGACTKPGHLMIVTELMEKSFHEISTSKVDLFTKLKMAKEAAKGMSWLHSLSPAIIHRDLKPENILVNQSRKAVKIADFGLSLVKDHSKQEAEEMKRIRGSPAFMSPEALLGNDLTPKTDVYSFGMILWELLTGKSPYDDLSIESFEQLIEEICEKGTREKIPEDCPPSFRKLIEGCWSPLPEQRPSFLQLITQLDECILEVAIADKEGRRMWKRHFTEANMLKAEVTWEAFLSAVSLTLRMSPGLKIFQGLKSMIVRENATIVSIDEFGNVLKWFGPMMNPNDQEDNFVYKMQNLLTKRWFHGDISLQDAQARLAGTEPGTFLIRFSSNPGQYALSKMIENQNKDHVIVHIRISHSPGGKYSFVLDGKVYEFGNLDELVKSSVLNLGKACPGSKYYAQFRIKQVHSGYVNTVNN